MDDGNSALPVLGGGDGGGASDTGNTTRRVSLTFSEAFWDSVTELPMLIPKSAVPLKPSKCNKSIQNSASSIQNVVYGIDFRWWAHFQILAHTLFFVF